jgi:peptide-methionine (R)-S-oxide reductase
MKAMTHALAHPARRAVLLGASTLGLAVAAGPAFAVSGEAAFANSPFRKLTPDDWRRRLPPASFNVLRQEGTERPFSSPLHDEHRRGTFICLGCDLPLFQSNWKFDSGTGWPSFFRIMESNVGKHTDYLIGVPRTNYRCARCLGHQGHVFEDGPAPTGLRFCNNGVALKFVPG